MIKPEMVPKEVVATLQPLLDEEDAPMLRYLVAAALNAWPGLHRADWNDKNELDPVIILPLPPQETRDGE